MRNHFDISIVSNRGLTNLRNRPRPVDVYVDGMRSSAEELADLPPEFLHGMELVSSSIGSPPGFLAGACGAIFVWTK